MRFSSVFFVFSILILACCSSSDVVKPSEPFNYLGGNWLSQRADRIEAGGEVISDRKFKPEGWLDAVVPGTVLATLLHNNLVPDPFFSMNNELIPDIYDTGLEHYTYWFYTTFKLPAELKSQKIWLKFRGINYKADVFLNGHKLNASPLKGMFKRFDLDITEFVNFKSQNNLAVIVFPPDPPGNAARGQGGDGTIGKNVTMQFTAGWDWIQPVRDRNTGIWDKVSVTATGPVVISDPAITTEVPGIRFPEGGQSPASITVSAELVNVSDRKILGKLEYICNGSSRERSVELAPKESRTLIFDTQKIEDPLLWWPNGSGPQNLYDVEFSFRDNKGKISDSKKIRIGLRDIDSYFDVQSGGRVFSVNGQKLFIRGGNWIASDAFLRLSPERYRAEVKKHAEANLNMIRIWGGSISERPEFYDACDECGMLVWQDFWITGDCNGAWNDRLKKDDQATRRLYPDDHSLFLESAEDTIKMLRNHPSLAFWSGGNEYPPPEDIDTALSEDIVPRLDKDREYFSYSTSPELSVISTGRIVDGPYSLQDPVSFFTRRFPPFNSEIGSVGVPVYDTLQKMMTEDELREFPRGKEVSESWRYHKYLGYISGGKDYMALYGRPESAAEFADCAQLVNYDQYRSLLEGWNSHMWDWYTGLLIWKTQNPWSALRGQLYDPFLDQNGGFFGTKKAAEPIHIQLNLDDLKIAAVNNTFTDLSGYSAAAEIYDISGEKILTSTIEQIDIKAASITEEEALSIPQNDSGVFFVHLALYDSLQHLVSENFYWLSPRNEDYSALHGLKEAQLQTSFSIDGKGQDYQVELTVKNVSDVVSFWNRLHIIDSKTGERILPVSYSDNYFSIIPGGEKTIRIEFTVDAAEAVSPELRLRGWNFPMKTWPLH